MLRCVVFYLSIVACASSQSNVQPALYTHHVHETLTRLIDYKNASVLSKTFIENTGFLYSVFGITSNCYVYYGWMHDVLDPTLSREKKFLNNTKSSFGASGKCAEKSIVLTETEGVTEKLMVVVDRWGQHVRVQNAFSGKLVLADKDLVWLKLSDDPKEFFFTQPVETGYTIESFFKVNARIYVVTTSFRKIRIYELRIFIDKNYNLIPYLAEEALDIQPLIALPREGVSVEKAQILKRADLYKQNTQTPATNPSPPAVPVPATSQNAATSAHTSAPVPSRPAPSTANNVQPIVNPGSAPPSRVQPPVLVRTARGTSAAADAIMERYSWYKTGLVMIPPEEKYTTSTLSAIPLLALFADSHDGLVLNHVYRALEYADKRGYFVIKIDEKGNRVLNQLEVYRFRMKKMVRQGGVMKHAVPGPLDCALMFSTNKFFNERNFHRRMSYPHSIHRMVDRNLLNKGWAELAPIYIGTVALMIIITSVLSCWVKYHQTKARRQGRSTSFTTSTL